MLCASEMRMSESKFFFNFFFRTSTLICKFFLVKSCSPQVAAAITARLSIPIIGIGAGPHVSGQVLVYHDLLGMMTHPHHESVSLKFVKQVSNQHFVGPATFGGLQGGLQGGCLKLVTGSLTRRTSCLFCMS